MSYGTLLVMTATYSTVILPNSFAANDQANIARLTQQGQTVQDTMYATLATGAAAQIATNTTTIAQYDEARQALLQARLGDPLTILQNDAGIGPGVPDPTLPPAPDPSHEADYWTSVSVSVAATYDATQESSSSNSYSAGGAASWGAFSIGGSASHSDSASDAARQMANSSIKASFDCMRVDITRSWLRPELFYDDDLKCAPNT